MSVLGKGEFMQLLGPLKKFFPPPRAGEKPKYFLALILGENKIWAVVFEEVKGRVEILGTSCENLSSSIGQVEQEELLEVTDRAIAQAEENLPPNISTSQTILGLESEWVEEGRIKKEYLGSLKKLKEELGLEFLGFLVTMEAVCHLLQKEEGVPPTSILVSKNEDSLTIVLIQAGRIEKYVKQNLDDQSPAQVLEKALRTFKDLEILPSRMTLFGQDNPEELKQGLLSFPWTKTLPFLHFPKVEILEEDFVRRAVVSGFATQMGVEFEFPKEAAEKTEIKEIEGPKGTEETKVEGEVFGFIKEKDVLEKTQPFPELPSFQPRFKLPIKLPFKLPKISLKFNFHFLNKIPALDFSQFKKGLAFLRGGGRLRLIIIPALIFLLLVGGYLFLPQATVSLFVTPKTLELEKEAIFDPTLTQGDLNKNKIKATTVETDVSDNFESSATGKKEVGENAKGEVTIYNSSAQMITLSAGTVITGPNSLKFSLDDKVTIASASGDIFSGTTPSKANVKVTAAQIGEGSNFPSGTVFNFAALSNVAARNENPFSGGSKKEVKVVSKKDQDDLAKTLLDKLSQKAKDDLLKMGSEKKEKIMETTLTQEILEKKFSRQVNEEAEKFSLSLKVKFKVLSFNEREVQDLFQEQINQSVPQGFVLKPGGVAISFGKTKTVNKIISGQIFIKATLLPNIDQTALKNKIRGKTVKEALAIITATPNVSDYKIKITPAFPLLPKKLPLRLGSIKVEILEHA